MSIKGYPTSEKVLDSVEGIESKLTDCTVNYVTLQQDRSKRVLLDVTQKSVLKTASDKIIESGSTKRLIKCSGHGLKEGDLIRITTGQNQFVEIGVKYVIDNNSFIVDGKLQFVPSAGDKFNTYVYLTNDLLLNGSKALSAKNYKWVNFTTSPLNVNASQNISPLFDFLKINITNNSGGVLELYNFTNTNKIIIAPGYTGTIEYKFVNTDQIFIKNIGAAIVNSGNLFLNFIVEE